ncbi:hypothetical protein HJFPF1_10389 [Paramyrothecium foliicola]|nr:hypothetical protein HJFPF1_10389 [Paramyrothecium foliicola]
MMNYANMIEEKNLKKTFIIATLCSTLVGTFTSSIGLWDRVKARRKQTARDMDQDEEIRKLKAQVEEAEEKARHPKDVYHPARDRVGDSLERSGALISREFDDGYERLGRRFAIGDTVTENKLQAQIIALQQTVINVLQDALYNGRQLDRHDMAKLVAASDAARDHSLDALRAQRQRQMMMLEAPSPPMSAAPMSVAPASAPRSTFSSRPRSSTTSSNTSLDTQRLYCRYSLDLQYMPDQPLASSFSPTGDGRCPVCKVRLAVEPDDCWSIEKRARARSSRHGRKEYALEEREYQLGQRFVAKCHLPDGRYACVLCNRFREQDTICEEVDDLVDHVGRDHDIAELEREMDFEVRSRIRPLPRALPAP